MRNSQRVEKLEKTEKKKEWYMFIPCKKEMYGEKPCYNICPLKEAHRQGNIPTHAEFLEKYSCPAECGEIET